MGKRATKRPRLRRIDPEDWKRLLAERPVPEGGHRVPSNLLARPIQEPPMRRVKAD